MIEFAHLTEAQYLKYREWMDSRPVKAEGATGGRITYQITPTTLGTVIKVIDNCTQDSLDLTEYEHW